MERFSIFFSFFGKTLYFLKIKACKYALLFVCFKKKKQRQQNRKQLPKITITNNKLKITNTKGKNKKIKTHKIIMVVVVSCEEKLFFLFFSQFSLQYCTLFKFKQNKIYILLKQKLVTIVNFTKATKNPLLKTKEKKTMTSRSFLFKQTKTKKLLF